MYLVQYQLFKFIFLISLFILFKNPKKLIKHKKPATPVAGFYCISAMLN